MIKHPRTVTQFISAHGTNDYVPPGMALFIPETDIEVALRMFSIKDDATEILLFNPIAIMLGPKAAIPENVPEEKEIPEKDR